ncbi:MULTISPECIES: alpha/beta hydrolase [unclassified Pseudomonas]|uniref:alpha/beta hydrolase n=1 Tax=unclassified Pseudomonas TaxID=196821 RepID=UPI002AC90616|nr:MULTISPECIES: alpha/beta hydrolase [unclassified Pseudomonas]MEB0039288.1 alpha/beta hydrolase [Pseudomonas sp. MH10]MEB0119727.1 alpha/beta hydrolase [Pseudomonas sp. CCI1.2]WPX64895.1 alpha/beta hydrolase [Pseudomonas sp. MH10]
MMDAITRSFFYAGGRYVTDDTGKQLMVGQMYVEVFTPAEITQRYPLVMIHGSAQTATNWLRTPDGRIGWAEYFARQGYAVHVVDQPARGRSAWHAGFNGELGSIPVAATERYFTATAELGEWPQARRHTQWPGTGRQGDPVFDAFYASQVDYLVDSVETEHLFQAAGSALLDTIGPAILITHSQSGPLGWLLADARPQLVKAIVAVEPQGPPVKNMSLQKALKNQTQDTSGQPPRVGGITDIPLAYDPPLAEGQALVFVQQDPVNSAERVPCWLQQPPARQLLNLAHVPVLIVTGEASFHALYDHGTYEYLIQAGVPCTHWRLEDFGLYGNGHMLMLERNHLEIAELLSRWIAEI